MRHIFFIILSFLLLPFSITSSQGAINILIVDGFSNHDWKRTTSSLIELLHSSEKYTVAVSTFPASGTPEEQKRWNPNFEQYDIIIQNTNGGPKGGIAWPLETRKHFEKYISSGGSMMAFHSANNAFREWDAYNQMLGLAWRDKNFGAAITIGDDGKIIEIPPGKGMGTSHGERIDALITRLGDHPIHKGLPRQWKAADIEVYSYQRGPAKNITILSFAKEPVTGLNFPIEWITTYGKGRVYTSTLGHVWPEESNLKGIRCAGFQTVFFRAIDWLARTPSTTGVPSDFPTPTETSLREIKE